MTPIFVQMRAKPSHTSLGPFRPVDSTRVLHIAGPQPAHAEGSGRGLLPSLQDRGQVARLLERRERSSRRLREGASSGGSAPAACECEDDELGWVPLKGGLSAGFPQRYLVEPPPPGRLGSRHPELRGIGRSNTGAKRSHFAF